MSEMIPKAVLPFKRKTWKPIVIDDDSSAPTGSKFGGRAYLTTGESYPHCPNCGRDLQLFVQLNLSELPEDAQREFGARGIVQLFYCTSEDPLCENDCQAWAPFSASVLARLVTSEEFSPKNVLIIHPADDENLYPPKAITGWTEVDDYPNVEELETLGVTLNDDESDDYYESDYPRAGDKLSGYPCWIQGIEYPNCPACGEKMRLLFQIDSEDNVPFMFGDAGCAHLTQCQTHKEQLAFGWACS